MRTLIALIAAIATGDGKKDEQPVPDEDPLGEKLLKTETPLEDAQKLWRPLEKLAGRRMETWTVGYDIHIRRSASPFCGLSRSLMTCRNVSCGIEMPFRSFCNRCGSGTTACQNPSFPPDQSVYLTPFVTLSDVRAVASVEDLPSAASVSIDSLIPNVIGKDVSSEDFNTSFLSRHPTSPPHILGAARGLLEIKRASNPLPEDTVDEIKRVLLRLIDQGVPPSIPVLLEAIDLLHTAGASPAVVDELKVRYKERLPLAMVFESDTERAKRLAEREAESIPNGKADV